MKSNNHLTTLVSALRKHAIETESRLWRRIALELERPTRNRRAVNLYHIDRSTREGEVVVVPGKVLGTGEVTRALTVAAFSFSDQAREKIAAHKGKAITIAELMHQNPKARKVRIIG